MVLTTFDDETAIPLLIAATRHPDPNVRGTAAYDLGNRRRSSEGVVQSIIDRLADPNESVRRSAALALGKFPGQPDLIVLALLRCLHDPSGGVQECAAQSLGCLGENAKVAVPRLVQITKLQVRCARLQVLCD
jgi:HEAT repeat protein